MACDGGVTLVWQDAAAVWASGLAGTGGTGACDGLPGTGPWSPAVRLSSATAGANLVDLATNDAGMALAVWQEGSFGNPSVIMAAMRSAEGTWQAAQTVSQRTGNPTWNPKPGLDAAGNAAVGYLDGYRMVVARKPAAGNWGAPEPVSGSLSVYYPSLAMSAAGDLLASWMAYDASGMGAVWGRMGTPAGQWTDAVQLSHPAADAGWPSTAFSADGSVAVVGWTDNANNLAQATVWTASGWKRNTLGGGWWGSTVPVAAGGGAGVAGWAQPAPGNPNSATLLVRTWQ